MMFSNYNLMSHQTLSQPGSGLLLSILLATLLKQLRERAILFFG